MKYKGGRLYKTDVQIAQQANMLPITEVAQKSDIQEELELYGRYKAKVSLDVLERLKKPVEKLVLVTVINLTPAREGKTTNNIGLSMALNKIGKILLLPCVNHLLDHASV